MLNLISTSTTIWTCTVRDAVLSTCWCNLLPVGAVRRTDGTTRINGHITHYQCMAGDLNEVGVSVAGASAATTVAIPTAHFGHVDMPWLRPCRKLQVVEQLLVEALCLFP
jgi:hypothetical protein